MNATCEMYRDGSNVPEILTREVKNNDFVDGTENLSQSQLNN